MHGESRGLPDLIDRLNAGDRPAGDELFTHIYPRLVRLAALMLGTFPDIRRQHDAESLVHDAWIDLQTALRTVKPEDPRRFLSLAARKARLALLDIAKRERRRRDTVPLGPAAADPDDSTPVIDPSAGSSSDPGRLEVWTRFHEAVGALPDELREAFELHFYSDGTPNQGRIGTLLGLPPRTVSRRITRAKVEIAERVVGLAELLA